MASTSSSSTNNAFNDSLPQPLLPTASSSMVYHVFLNHRGCDVKEGLVRDIYHALNGMGLRVFLDQEILQFGTSIPKQIEDAIRSVSLCIAIFSPNYADSPWCLEELSFMVKNRTRIIPIFYNVSPSDLRWVAQGKGVYGRAFYLHKEKRRYTAQKLEEWETALSYVSFHYGYELKNKKDEGRLSKTIVNYVLKDLQIVPLEVARHPVGLDEIVEDFKKCAFKSYSEQHVNVVGIVGMGGSGKTTLAKELYNRECSNIARHSFIFDVRDAAAKNTLRNLQEKLLQDLTDGSFTLRIHSLPEGIVILRRRLRSLRVLIVLDDVGDVDQIEALLPGKSIFAEGSLIIVTTTESNVLQLANISCIYKMKALNPFHAKQLFCWHAFMQSDPVHEFEELVEKCMKACQGFPLALKVLGAQLYKRPKEYWHSQLDKIFPLSKYITKSLKISFDTLEEEEKEMFLDTACFFLGEEKSLAIEVWNGSGWSGLQGWETLLSKCLVELDPQNCIRMHDHLRDMGREIAMERPPYRLFPSADLDIWRQRQAQDRKRIRGIIETSTDRSQSMVLPSSDYRPFFKEYIETQSSSCGVRLLVAVSVWFSEEYATLSKTLQWLRLFRFQHSCLPSWLSLENLRVLEFYDAPDLKELWQDNMEQPPLQLRQLIIDLGWEKRSLQSFPKSIGRLLHLKKLSCIGGNLQNLPEGFCNLQSLEHLELQELWHLSSLPRRFGDLTNLRHLNLADCNQLKILPDSFKHLEHLQYLNLKDCWNLIFTERNADILENTTKLEYLSFRGCKGLQVLPHHISKQAFLRELDLIGTSFSELPSIIGQLERLEVLKIGSAELESLPDSLEKLYSLTRLRIESCQKVRSLPESLGRLARLNSLEIFSTEVESLPKAFGHLTSLQTLSIDDSPISELFFELEESSSLPVLKTIILSGTRMSIMSIPKDSCSNLESLSVSYDDILVEIRTLPRSVKTITLEDCKGLKDVAGIGSLQNLQRLTIKRCPMLTELPSFTEFASMKEIEVKECQILRKMEGLEQLTSLETLEVQSQWEKPGITSLKEAQGLRRLLLSADKIGAVEPCIRTLQKWPGEVIICARALRKVESLVNAFTSSNLMFVEASADGNEGAEETERNDEADEYDEDDEDEEAKDGCVSKPTKTRWSVQSYKSGEWRLRYPQACLSHRHEATIVCFVINCLSQDDVMLVAAPPYTVGEERNLCSRIKLGEGKWVLIHVASKSSVHVQSDLKLVLKGGNKVEKGLLATGEERGIKDVFYQVLDVIKLFENRPKRREWGAEGASR